jgi:DNA-directed RNA polymerase specialized sigma24 family protein
VRVCFLICGDLHQAEDAAAAAWVVAWRKVGTVRDPQHLRAWLVAVAANEARQSVRRRRRRSLLSTPSGCGPPSGVRPRASGR